MLAITFLFPMVAAASAAAVAPVIIHLIMRTKPRRIIFPAMRFVKKTHQANLSKLRLKHLLLLLMRMAAIALIAVLIARAEVPSWSAVEDRSVPAAAVVLVDNSASMGYRHRGRTLLARGKRLAQQVLDGLPEGSRVAVVPTDGAPDKLAFQADRKFTAEQLAGIEPGCGARPLAPALARALAMLQKIDMPRKEVYIVSDMTAQSWRELKAVAAKDVAFVILNCSPGEDANLSLGEVRLDVASVPVGAEVALETVVRSAHVGGELEVRAELGGRPVESQSVVLQPGGSTAVTLTFKPTEPGVAHGRVFFQQEDPLAVDNSRYFTLVVGPPVGVLIVRDPTTVGRGDPTSFLMANAIAPGGADAAAWVTRETITADRLAAGELAAARIVVLSDVSSLSDQQWSALERFVRSGGGVWVVIGSLVAPLQYNTPAAQRIMPAALGVMEALANRVAWKLEKQGEPMLQPFASEANPPLSAVLCDRRLRIVSAAPDAHVPLRYADGKAAILTRKVGAGTVVLWNFSPARGFSNLAGLAQFPILAQRTVRLLAGGLGEQTAYTWGQNAAVAIPPDTAGALMTVRKPDSPAEEPVVVGLHDRVLTFRADRLGHWTVAFAQAGARTQRGFSVNVDFAESDLTGVDVKDLTAAFGKDRLVIASHVEDLARNRRRVTQPLDLAVPLLLGLLVLMTGESFFANRFYRRAQDLDGAVHYHEDHRDHEGH